MADAVISVAVERAAAILEDQIRYEVNLVRGVEKEVLYLSDKLKTIRTVLEDADKRGTKEQSVQRWLKKLENTAYEMEDILDEWHYAILNHKMEQTAKQKEKVCCSFIPSPSSCLCFKKVVVRHAVGIKIQDMKLKLDQILIEKDQFKFVTSLPGSDVEPTPLRVQSTSIELAKVQGSDIHNNKNKIVTKLMMDNSGTELLLLSIVGMGGLGKTTLAQLVYNDARVQDCFDLRIWICVSDPFDEAKIAREIVDSVGRETIPPNTSQLDLVLQKLRNSISGKKFLLVLDDVWSEDYTKWEPLRNTLKHGKEGSKIVATTRKEGVAEMMGTLDSNIYRPQHLSNEECWSLLRHVSLFERGEDERRKFEDVGRRIASKCKGLPLAARVLGSLLQSKRSLEEWENVLESEIWRLEKAEVDLFPHLLLSYNELSPALKRCFSYCAVYPKDSYIYTERLIEEWMAQGYLGSVRGNGGVEVKGRDYFNNLAMRSLFQDISKKSDGGEIGWCKMHDIVHDFALFLRKNDDAAAAMTKSSCQVCSSLLVSHVQEYRSLVWGKESPMNVCDCLASVRVLTFKWASLSVNGLPQGMKKLIHLRWLDLSRNDLSEEDLKIICRLYFLQTLLLSDCSLENIPREIGNLVELRHLDLSYNGKLTELPSEIGNLVELRHLDLNGNGELMELPSQIGNLVKLRHLNLSSNGKLMELPGEIGNLVELRHLNLSRNGKLMELPGEIGNLVELRHLDLSSNGKLMELPGEIGNLVELRHLDLNGNGELMELPSQIGNLVKLRHLNLSSNGKLMELPGEIGNLVELRHLNLSRNGKLMELPGEIGNLVELRHLDLSRNEELKVLPVEIGNLDELRHLDLSYNEDLKELPSEIGNLVELRHLDLSFSYELKELPESVCSLVELRILNLRDCHNLQVLPEGIHRLRNLQKLLIEETPASRCLPRGLGELSGLCTLDIGYYYGGRGWNKLGLLKKLNSLSGSLQLMIKIPSCSSDVEELVKDAEEADLRSKIHIHTLYIIFREDEVEGSLSLLSSLWMDLMEALEPNQQKLNELVLIHGYMGSRFPQWISSPFSLVKHIDLYKCNELSSLPPFGNLPSLELLEIAGMTELKYVGRELLGIESPSPSSSSSSPTTTNSKELVAFPKLKVLHISECWVLKEWEDITAEEEESAAVSVMPCLEKLLIHSCPSLKKLPHRLLRKASSSLRILGIQYSTLLESQYGDKEGSEWRSISQYNPHLQLH